MNIKKVALIVSGFIFLAIGAVGVVVPVLPTTPFVLIAAACFSSGNSRLSEWLKRNRVFGPYIENYRTKQGIELRLKIFSIIFLWLGLGISMFFVQSSWAVIALAAVGIAVTVHLLLIKTKARPPAEPNKTLEYEPPHRNIPHDDER